MFKPAVRPYAGVALKPSTETFAALKAVQSKVNFFSSKSQLESLPDSSKHLTCSLQQANSFPFTFSCSIIMTIAGNSNDFNSNGDHSLDGFNIKVYGVSSLNLTELNPSKLITTIRSGGAFEERRHNPKSELSSSQAKSLSNLIALSIGWEKPF